MVKEIGAEMQRYARHSSQAVIVKPKKSSSSEGVPTENFIRSGLRPRIG